MKRTFLVSFLINFPFWIHAKCPPGYIQGLTDDICFYKSHQLATWSDAEEDCVNRGGHLASVHNAFVNSLISRSVYSCNNHWTGGSRGVTTSSTIWTWTDGSVFDWTNWGSGNPGSQASLCLSLNTDTGAWNTFGCGQYLSYICAVKSRPDTRKASCPSGWTYFSITNKCYSLVFNVRYYEALTQCENEGATLASVHSAEANEVLLEFAAKNVDLTYTTWIGLHSPGNSGTWKWTDGSAFDFNNWDAADGYPLKPIGANATCVYAVTDVKSTDPPIWYHRWFNWNNCEMTVASAICQKDPAF